MDLNEKIAARRRELGIEAEKAKVAESVAFNIEVTKRLAEQGINQPAPTIIQNSATVDEAIDEAVYKSSGETAASRMPFGQHAWSIILIIIGLLSLMATWWLGAIFLFWAYKYYSGCIDRYKRQIIAEKRIENAFKMLSKADSAESVSVCTMKGKIELLEIFDDKIRISPVGIFGSTLRKVIKTIPLSSIIRIDIINATSFYNGYLHFVIPGGNEIQDISNAVKDDNCFVFIKKDNILAAKIKNYLEIRRQELRSLKEFI